MSFYCNMYDMLRKETCGHSDCRCKNVMEKICPTCGGTGSVVGEDGAGFRPPKSDREPADECPQCRGYGYVQERAVRLYRR